MMEGSLLSQTGSLALLLVMLLCVIITACCVAFDSHEGRGGLFMLKHGSTSLACRFCVVLFLFLSIVWAILVPVVRAENLVLIILIKIISFASVWFCAALLFVIVVGIASCFVKK